MYWRFPSVTELEGYVYQLSRYQFVEEESSVTNHIYFTTKYCNMFLLIPMAGYLLSGHVGVRWCFLSPQSFLNGGKLPLTSFIPFLPFSDVDIADLLLLLFDSPITFSDGLSSIEDSECRTNGNETFGLVPLCVGCCWKLWKVAVAIVPGFFYLSFKFNHVSLSLDTILLPKFTDVHR